MFVLGVQFSKIFSVNFEKTEKTYIFTIHFNISHMKKLLLICALGLTGLTNAQILVNESFEGTSVPSGWTSTSDTGGSPYTSFGTNSGAACVGAKLITVNLWSSSSSWYLIYTSSNSNATALTYSYKYSTKPYPGGSINGTLVSEYSVDGGTTWVEASPSVNLTTEVNCQAVSGTIPAGTIPSAANFKFRFRSTAVSGGDYYLGIDDVQLAQTVTSVPSCTTVSAPANGATFVSTTPTITWSSVGGASGYKISIGTTSGGTDVVNNVNVGTSTSYTVAAANPLLNNTTYYVSVTPTNSLGDATGCTGSSFTTLSIPCPTVNSPGLNATGVPLKPTIKWTSVTGATGYKLSLGTTSGGTEILNNVDLGNVTTYTLASALAPNTTYYYTVNSYNGSSSSASCTVRSFTTGPAAAVNDECSGAIQATLPYSAVVTDGAGTTSGGFVTGCSTNNDGLWYKFTGNGGPITVAITGVQSTFDPKLAVYTGSCGAFTCQGSADAGVNGGGETYTFTSVAGTTYYVNVGHWSGSTDSPEGNFTIAITTSLGTQETSLVGKAVQIYPNPFSDIVKITNSDKLKSAAVLDASGRVVAQFNSPVGEMNLSKLSSGVYMIQVKYTDGTSQTFKAIKK